MFHCVPFVVLKNFMDQNINSKLNIFNIVFIFDYQICFKHTYICLGERECQNGSFLSNYHHFYWQLFHEFSWANNASILCPQCFSVTFKVIKFHKSENLVISIYFKNSGRGTNEQNGFYYFRFMP